MIQNVQIEIEQFDNGITYRWHDLDGEFSDDSSVAIEKQEADIIGKDIWGDIKNVMDCSCENKVRMTIKYEAI